eukprot:GFUD01015912.1.p1 GENE.GFUD01015912.1~~GFUD01015912.1.p1  ORF type:complete len:322 (-),score=76.97 GFUD01015912.1:117-1082(-)
MGSNEDFCLKWNDHHSIFFSLAESLCRSSLLTDVTLATSDQTFPAHKLVLSVCSSFFRDLFSKPELNNMNQSVVYLKDVSSRQLEMLLSYMYRGEINVEEADLVKLLQTAKGLGVKGLSEVDDQNAVNFGKKTQPDTKSDHGSSKKRARTEQLEDLNVKQVEVYEDVIEVAPPKEIDYDNIAEDSVEVVEPNIETINSNMEIADDGSWYEDGEIGYGDIESYNGSEEQDGFVQGMMAGARKPEFPEPPLNCPQCPKTFASTWHLKRHVQTHTKEKRFKCDLCGKYFSRNDNLKSHQKSVHGLMLQPSATMPGSSGSRQLDY